MKLTTRPERPISWIGGKETGSTRVSFSFSLEQGDQNTVLHDGQFVALKEVIKFSAMIFSHKNHHLEGLHSTFFISRETYLKIFLETKIIKIRSKFKKYICFFDMGRKLTVFLYGAEGVKGEQFL